MFPLKLEERVAPRLSQLLVVAITLGSWLHHPNLSLCGYMASPCVPLSSRAFPSCYKDTSHSGLRLTLKTSSYPGYIGKNPICK